MKLEGVGGRSQAPSFPCRILVLTQTLSTQKLLRGRLTATTDVSLSSSKVTALPLTGQKASVWLGCVWHPSPPLVQEPALTATRESRGLSGSAKYTSFLVLLSWWVWGHPLSPDACLDVGPVKALETSVALSPVTQARRPESRQLHIPGSFHPRGESAATQTRPVLPSLAQRVGTNSTLEALPQKSQKPQFLSKRDTSWRKEWEGQHL